MYVLQSEPDEGIVLRNGGAAKPLATLKDEYGGISHIIKDDQCYMLVNGSEEKGFIAVKHWYHEAVEALKSLPSLRVRQLVCA